MFFVIIVCLSIVVVFICYNEERITLDFIMVNRYAIAVKIIQPTAENSRLIKQESVNKEVTAFNQVTSFRRTQKQKWYISQICPAGPQNDFILYILE